MTDAEKLLHLARNRGAIIATAESCTGGMIAAALTDIPGSSDVVDRGFVTYSNAAKIEMLGVPERLIKEYGAVSEEVARVMAEGALRQSNATVTVAVTGIAGPGASEFKPEGRVCFGLATEAETTVETQEFGSIGRAKVRQATVDHALRLLHHALA